MRVFITGATGYIGKALVRELLKNGYELDVLVRNRSKLTNIFRDRRIRVFHGTLDDNEVLEQATRRADVVIHLAACIHIFERRGSLKRVNIQGTRNLLDACEKARREMRFIFASSIEAGGPSKKGIITLEDSPSPISDYGLSKLKGERIVMDYSRRTPKIVPNIVRIGNVYEKGTGMLRAFHENLSRKDSWKTYALYEVFGDYTLDFIHMDDLVRMFSRLLKTEKSAGKKYYFSNECLSISEIFDIVSNNSMDIKKRDNGLVRLRVRLHVAINKILKRSDLVTYLSLGEERICRKYDNSTTVKDLKYSPKVTLRSLYND